MCVGTCIIVFCFENRKSKHRQIKIKLPAKALDLSSVDVVEAKDLPILNVFQPTTVFLSAVGAQ